VMERCRSEPPARVTVEPGHAVSCFHAYDAEGDDWYRLVNERIEQAIATNASVTPQPPPVAALAPVRTVPTSPTPKATAPAPARGARRALAPLTATPRRQVLAVVLTLALLSIALTAWRSAARRHTAQRQLELVAAELGARARITGTYPESLSELGWRLPPIFGRTEAIDPWGRALVYRPPAASGGAFELKSLGPDGVPSADDLPRKR
jgi:hypothetical protein